MTAGSVFWALVWLIVWASVILMPVCAWWAFRQGRAERGQPYNDATGWFVTAACTFVGWIFWALVVVAFATGEWTFTKGLLPDGCYRVAHETYLAGKTVGERNTFEQIEGCR